MKIYFPYEANDTDRGYLDDIIKNLGVDGNVSKTIYCHEHKSYYLSITFSSPEDEMRFRLEYGGDKDIIKSINDRREKITRKMALGLLNSLNNIK